MKCKPCQASRIRNIISQLKQLHAIETHQKGDTLYLKTFLINDKRNNNGWRASWESIKQNVKSFHGRPGIEYRKCGKHGCMLDHTDADSFDENIHVQEKYRVTTIVDTVLDESTHTAYAIHMVDNAEFAEKIKRNEIKYLSPSIWPNKEKTTMYLSEKDEWYIDTTGWTGLHDAWVDSPAFGHKARIVGKCTGDASCVTELKNDRSLTASQIYRIKKIISQLRAKEGKQDKENGRWITVKGTHIFIPDGKSIFEVLEEKFGEDAYGIGENDVKEDSEATKETQNTTFRLDESLQKKIDQTISNDSEFTEIMKTERGKASDALRSSYELHDMIDSVKGDRTKQEKLASMLGSESGASLESLHDSIESIFYSPSAREKTTSVMQKLYADSDFKPFVAKRVEAVSTVNEMMRQKYENTSKLYRGTTVEELDSMLNNEYVGDTDEPELKGYNFTSFTVNAEVGKTFGGDVILEFDKETIHDDVIQQGYGYSFFDSHEDSTPNGITFAHEQEVRVPVGKSRIKDQKITLRFNAKLKPQAKQLKAKYGKLGEIKFE